MLKISMLRASLWLAGSSLCALSAPAFAAAPAPAEAPAAEAAETEQLTDIIVTAEKRPQSLQTTPIAISVLGSQDIANRHVTSLLDLGDGAIPSLKVAPFYSRNSALVMNIRGIGVLSDSNQPARDQGVGIYIDGVYMGRAQGLGTAIYDVENIEVLKGPQGTLFGRNTEGGAVNITTKKPSGQFKANMTAGFGNYGSYKGEVHLDLPAWHDIAVKIDGVVAHRDAMVKNPLEGQYGFNYYNKRGLHVEALWKPAPNFSADYAYDTSYDASTPLYLQLLSAPTASTVKLATLGTVQATRAGSANVGVPQQLSIGKTWGHRLTLEWEAAPKITLKSISSYRNLNQSQYDNGSAATTMVTSTSGNFNNANFSRYSLAQFRQNQVSQELQLIGEIPHLKFVAGGLFYQEKVQDNAQAFYTNQFTNAAGSAYIIKTYDMNTVSIDRASHVTATSLGAFGQATYTPPIANDHLHLTGGLRFTRDKKVGQLFIINGTTPTVNGVTRPQQLNAAWTRVDPMVNLAYDLTRDMHVYGKWSTGYKSGGANSRSLTYAPFKPETVSMFEIGAKTEFLDRHARLNVAAYTGSYKNIQLDFQANYQQFDANGNLITTGTRTTIETANAPGTGRLKGVEAELTLVPITGLTLTGSYAYTKVKIPNTSNPFPQGTSQTVNPLPIPIYAVYTPTNSASASITYEVPARGFTLRGHMDFNYDNGFYQGYSDPVYNGPGAASNVYQPKGDSAFIVNGRIAFADIDLGQGGAKLTVAGWARNLLNEQHVFYKAFSTTVGTNGFYNEARTYGLEANVRF
ncbi:TonB-dependent receptor [Novosphingobium rosa]|uniref:TonB-dependent receptor n=1 Tax=Novosphingobium rosa TaxID=76978 RepID=UPI00082E2ED5|nr:TonB-dependent receptor [Novosphingobium rosa]